MSNMAALRIEGCTLRLGGRAIWQDLSLTVDRGEFLTVIGPNGSGKTSLLKVLLGLLPATGVVEVLGRPARRGDRRIGYIPQQRGIDDMPLRGRDLVALGVDGTRWGFRLRAAAVDGCVRAALAGVSALAYAEAPVGQLSGGEQQRLRIAQALVGEPELLLCDEPLLSLDLYHQREICDLIAAWRDRTGGTVVFVTHDVNPVLAASDRILAVVGGRWAAGTPAEVLRTETMSRLYGSPVDVLRVRGRVIVVAEAIEATGGHHEHVHEPIPRRAP
jgi:zinc/manganese transport system ATP-binding protein